MARNGAYDNKSRMPVRQCAGCGKIIESGLYCQACLEKFRERAKTQNRQMELLKNNSLRKVVQERREIVILIVINDERNLNLTKLILERSLPEYKILATSNTLNAINTLISREVNLVILDADYNGVDMLIRIREDDKFKDTPVMMMSGSTERELVANVFSFGVQDYVTKPCEPNTLVERINKLLQFDEEEAAETQSKVAFKILLIDDDIFDLRQERDTLKNRLPCEIVTSQSAVEGMKILENDSIDLILVSLDMPFVNGLKFLSLVNGNAKFKRIPAIIMTDSRDFKILSEIERSTAVGYIRKPNINEDGLALIETKLRRRR